MDCSRALVAILHDDPARMHLLRVVRSLALPDCWVAAGFVRNAVWDHLHGRPPSPAYGDVDVIWHNPACANASEDARLEARLEAIEPGVEWSVKNQARMHLKNGDLPYASATHAMMFWVETTAAIAVRLEADDSLSVAAPVGIDDIFDMQVRPMGRFCAELHPIYVERMRQKAWQHQWPRLMIAA